MNRSIQSSVKKAPGRSTLETLRRTAGRDSSRSIYANTTSDTYGREFRKFAWGYAVDALPRPTSRTSSGSRLLSYSDDVLDYFMEGVIRDLKAAQGNDIIYAYILETGKLGQRHVHAYVGSISRLAPNDVQRAFRSNGFGDTNVKLWNPAIHSGYYFKTIDEDSRGYSDANWNFNVTWNRNCRQRMLLMRRHLDRMLLARPRAA